MCDREFIAEHYGDENGEIKLLAGEISEDSYQLIITDFVADSYLRFNTKYKTYEDILEAESRIGAIIDTDYETLYADLIEKYEEAEESGTDLKKLYNRLAETELHQKFQREVVYTLGISYSINPDFESAYLKKFADNNTFMQYVKLFKDGKEYPKDDLESFSIYRGSDEVSETNTVAVSTGEIAFTYTEYNKIFGTNYTLQTYATDFTPHDVTIKVYDKRNDGNVAVFEHTYTVVALTKSTTRIGKEDYYEIRDYSIHAFGLYLENNENLDSAVTALADYDMYPKTTSSGAIVGTNKMLEIFIPLFKLFGGGLYAFIIIYLLSYAITGIKKNYFRIGVMRAMGAKISDVGLIFVTGVVLMGICIVSLMLLFQNLIVDMYNSILVESFSIVLDTYTHGMSVVKIAPETPLVNAILVLSITFISALICVVILHRLKPIEIIRAKDNGGEVS